MPEPKMSGADRLGVFIDADNFNDATALDHVLTDVHQRAARVVYKRAYGRAESLKAIEAVLWRHGVRPVANLIVNKVTTDSALVIDAVEAMCEKRFETVAICSGDADFVPLATWLREKGCRIWCFSLAGQIFANPESFYDDVVLLEVVQPQEPVEPSAPLAVATSVVAPVASAVSTVACKVQPSPKPTAVLPQAPAPAGLMGKATVQQVLNACPALSSGQPQHLNQVVKVLREQGILGAGIKTSQWFAQWPAIFVLSPPVAPNRIVYKPKVPQAGDGVPALPAEVRSVLQSIPQLLEAPQQLSQLVPVLRKKTILGKSTKSTRFFARYPTYFKLSPSDKPTHVAYMAPRVA